MSESNPHEVSPEPDGTESEEIPRGSYAAGYRVALPAGAERPITVFVNGVAKTEGPDYAIGDGEVVFVRPIVKERVSGFRWLIMLLGAAGSYRRNDTIDIEFRRNGRTELVSDLPVAG